MPPALYRAISKASSMAAMKKVRNKEARTDGQIEANAVKTTYKYPQNAIAYQC